MQKLSISEILERLSPVMIEPSLTSIKIELSNRFLLFELLREITAKIEDDPYLNFISILKYYKVLGKFLHGTIYEIHRDRNKTYFKDFFFDTKLYRAVKEDIEWVYSKNRNIRVTITKKGIITYDNYNKGKFNILMLTVHSGSWVPGFVIEKQQISPDSRLLEEDIGISRIYGRLVLEKSGIWVDNKMSRFACDFNRAKEKAIYRNYSEEWLDILWKKELKEQEKAILMDSYNEFYFTLSKLVESYKFNIIFDGHSMKHAQGRPDISFGTVYIPRFYMPIVISIKEKLDKLGYYSVSMNSPFSGGHILKWLGSKFPNVFTFSMEVNKRLYMTEDNRKLVDQKVESLSSNIAGLFDI